MTLLHPLTSGALPRASSLLGACIATVGVGVVAWVLLLVPAATDPGLARAVPAAHLLADLVLLSCALRLAFAGSGRPRSSPVVARMPDGQPGSTGRACWDGTEPPVTPVERADIVLPAAERSGRDRALLATR